MPGGVKGWLQRHSVLVVLAAYALLFGVFFWHIHSGVGQYWDWSFPYFSDQIQTIFTNKDSSWIAANGGSPLNYASDYFFRFFMGLFVFLPPETLHYLLLTAIFAAGALGSYLLTRPYTSRWLAFLLGLLAWVNPAIFYKYTAGHFNYFLSFALFIFFLHFLLHYFRKDFRSAVVVGLFFAFLGIQIQFFIIGGIFLAVFLVFNRDKVAPKYLPVMFGLPLLINLVWLMNFITGAADTVQTGANAAKVSFKALSASSFLNIFTFSFSKATLLSRFYVFYELLWNAILFVFLLWLLARGNGRRKERFDLVLLVFLAVMIFMATGMYQAFSLYPLTLLYPMLREVGHFAPIIILAALLLIARLVEYTRWRWALLLVIVGSLFIVGVKFEYFSQNYNFASVRQQFAPFKQVADKDTGTYRILAYPFFSQYALKTMPQDPPGQLPLKNTGHDSFAAFAKQPFINNAVAPYQFQDSPQNRLLQTYNIDVLRPYNVKYIFDFSNIYTSNYSMYVPASTYNNDVKLIKNDPHFFDKLLTHNPGRVRKVSAHVLEVTDYQPRISSTSELFSAGADDQTEAAGMFTRQELGRPFDYVGDDSALAPYTTHLTQLFGSPDTLVPDKTTQTFNQTLQVAAGTKATLYTSESYRPLSYQATTTSLTVYAQATPPLLLNGKTLGAGDSRQVLAQAAMQKGASYYLSIGGKISAVTPGSSGDLGTAKVGDIVQILSGGSNNIVANPSFEQDLWEKRARDCNAYDGNGSIGMQRVTGMASVGHASLELSTTRHDACTATEVNLDKNTQYLLNFDYQSDDAPTASYYLAFANQTVPLSKGSRAIGDHKWHTATALVDSGDQSGHAQLFMYALEGDGRQKVTNHYDAVRLAKLTQVASATLPAAKTHYAMMPLGTGQQQFTFQDPSYHYRNIIADPSFEKGSWQAAVSDCNAYDNLPRISMRLDPADKTAGKQSLELSAAHHDACIHATANVQAGADYLLNFDYKTGNGGMHGYAVSFDDPSTTTSRTQLPSAGPGWHTARIKIHAPQGATTLTLYLYAFEGSSGTNAVHYDRVSLAQLPDFTNRFFVVASPDKQLKAPKDKTFMPSQSVRTLQITGATTPFFVSLNETYHRKWRLELDNGSVGGMLKSWLPGAPATTVGTQHTEFSGASNGWLVEPSKLCVSSGHVRSGCTKNTDGSYNIKLKVEFVPQRWFAIGAVISWVTVIAAAAYLIVVRPKDPPTYRHKRHA
jgi:hypothetical protein